MFTSFIISLLLLIGSPAQGTSAQTQPTHQCEAITKQGTRCKIKAEPGSRYCHIHKAKNPSVPQCKAKTKAGSRCSRPATNAGYCKQHYDMHKAGKL